MLVTIRLAGRTGISAQGRCRRSERFKLLLVWSRMAYAARIPGEDSTHEGYYDLMRSPSMLRPGSLASSMPPEPVPGLLGDGRHTHRVANETDAEPARPAH